MSGDKPSRTAKPKPKRKVPALVRNADRAQVLSGHSKRTTTHINIVLDTLAEGWSVTEAARRAGIDRPTIYKWKKEDPEFAAMVDAAMEAGTDRLEDAAYRRSVEGTDKPITYQGQVTGTYKEYSDTLTTVLLKGRRPHKYKDRVANELSGPDGGPILVERVERVIVDAKPDEG